MRARHQHGCKDVAPWGIRGPLTHPSQACELLEARNPRLQGVVSFGRYSPECSGGPASTKVKTSLKPESLASGDSMKKIRKQTNKKKSKQEFLYPYSPNSTKLVPLGRVIPPTNLLSRFYVTNLPLKGQGTLARTTVEGCSESFQTGSLRAQQAPLLLVLRAACLQ